tara:strand:- start:193 stop:297 length:105 start_codon:yes stop_codon:yes gene_type:complete
MDSHNPDYKQQWNKILGGLIAMGHGFMPRGVQGA